MADSGGAEPRSPSNAEEAEAEARAKALRIAPRRRSGDEPPAWPTVKIQVGLTSAVSRWRQPSRPGAMRLAVAKMAKGGGDLGMRAAEGCLDNHLDGEKSIPLPKAELLNASLSRPEARNGRRYPGGT